MKRKIVLMILCLAVCLSMSISAFAANNAVPPLPESQSNYWVIEYRQGVYTALDCERVTHGSNSLTCYNAGKYVLTDGEWIYQSNSSTYTVFDSQVAYDTSGSVPPAFELIFLKPVGFDDITGYYDGLVQQITVDNVVQVIVVGVGISVGLVFMWWGVRKAVRAIMSAFRKGRVSL